jgi:hypothetical protein
MKRSPIGIAATAIGRSFHGHAAALAVLVFLHGVKLIEIEIGDVKGIG